MSKIRILGTYCRNPTKHEWIVNDSADAKAKERETCSVSPNLGAGQPGRVRRPDYQRELLRVDGPASPSGWHHHSHPDR